MFSHVLILTFIAITLALYEGNSPVKLLTDQTFQKMIKSKTMWMVQFFSPQCGHCVSSAPQYEKAANIAEGVINFAAVDMTKYPSLGSPYGIRGYPTFKFFGANKQSPVDYNGQRSAQDFVQFSLTQTKQVITQRANVGKSDNSQKKQSQSNSGSKGGKVKQITDSNFQQKVLKSQDAWFIDFYSPSCGHCKNLEPEFVKLPDLMKGKVKIAKVDATVSRNLASKYGIKGYPTLIFFPKGNKDKTINYEGQRSAEDMSSWLNSQKIGPAKVELLELSQVNYNKECQKNNVCVLILVKTDEQIKNLKFLKEVMQKNSQSPIRYFYTKQGLNTLQSDLMIDDRAYPKVLALLPSRNSYKTFNKAFESQTFGNFIQTIFNTNWIRFNNKIQTYLFPESNSNNQL